jgi:RNA polymerase sigma-70 factor (ECF subfamily)
MESWDDSRGNTVKSPLPSDSADHEFFHLLENARQGDADALGRLIENYRPYLLKIAFEEGDSNLNAKAGDSDLVQDTCLAAVRDFGHFKGKTTHEMRAWLRQILLHQVKDFRNQFRTNKRDINAEVPLQKLDVQDSRNDYLKDYADSPSKCIMLREDYDWLEKALAELPQLDRKIIELRQKDGRPFAEIASDVQMTEEAVQKRWVRAIQALQAKVGRPHESAR